MTGGYSVFAEALLLVAMMSVSNFSSAAEPEYKIRVDRSTRVRMRDGVELATVIVRPDVEGRFPAIMNYTPYRGLTTVKDTYSEREYNNTTEGPAWFAGHGYAVVYFDVRGTGNSGGSSQDVYGDEERRDAYEMVEWIGTRPWCNGNVGMWGYSYSGVDQWQVGVQNPPHLKTLVVGSSNDDVYLDWTHPGGALRPYMFDNFAPMMTGYNFAPPDLEMVGDKWSDLWTERLEKNVPWGIGFISHPVHDRYWMDRSLQPDYGRIRVPVMLWSGWSDCYPTPILRAFSRLRVPKKVLIGPGGHWWPGMAVPGPRIDERRELLRWYDQWLKGRDTGVTEEPPITLFVRTYKEPQERMYDEDAGFWRHEKEWPPARSKSTAFYLNRGGKLSPDGAGGRAERDEYAYDATVGTTSGIYWGGGILPWGMPLDQRADEAASLTYTTEPLPEALEATGAPRVVLHISSTADAAYFHVKITDVAQDGVSKWVSDGGLLTSHRTSHEKPEPIEPGTVYELTIDLKYMAYVFPAGHRIRLDVASADFQNAWPVGKAAVNTVHRGGNYASRLVLPVTPVQLPALPPPDLHPSAHVPPKPEDFGTSEHTITRDLVNQTVTVNLVKTTQSKSADGLTASLRDIRSSYTVSRTRPADATIRATMTYDIQRPEGKIHVQASDTLASDAASFRYLTEVEITLDGKPHFRKSWRVSVPRMLN
jgi:predicted acyl esterase